MATIALNLAKIYQHIRNAELQYGRPPNSVQLLAVSKGQSAAAIRQAAAGGQLAFGENYLQEAVTKITALADLNLQWHFIGAVQTNKTRTIAQHFSWLHSLERLAVAERLNNHRDSQLPPLNVCIQVNVDEEATKAGVRLEGLAELAKAIVALPRLKLRGLMVIPTPRTEFELQRGAFRKIYLAFEHLQQQGFQLDTLSMGMSDDFVAAIAEGATFIRIGTALFGKRSV